MIKYTLKPRSMTLMRFSTIGRIQPMKQAVMDVKEEKKAGKWKRRAVEGGNWIIVFSGLGILGAMIYFAFEDFFAPNFPQQIYEEASRICLSSEELQRHMGSGLRATFGPPNVSRVPLASFTHFSGSPPRKHLIVQFTISSPKSSSSSFGGGGGGALITATAIEKKKNSFVLDRIDANLPAISNDGRRRNSTITIWVKKNKSRFGF
jgi:hypothetical protein